MVDLAQLLTLEDLERAYVDADGKPLFPVSTVRGWIARDEGGMRGAVMRMGSRRYVDLAEFRRVLERRKGESPRRRLTTSEPVPAAQPDRRPTRFLIVGISGPHCAATCAEGRILYSVPRRSQACKPP